MASAELLIRGGTVYDPANGVNGELRDVCLSGGKVVDSVSGGRVIDATGLVVMPGGVDMHAHIAGPKVNMARKMLPELHRRGTPFPPAPERRGAVSSVVPGTFATGYMYAGLGYTTAVDAAVAPLGARHAHEEFNEIPALDKLFFVLMGNNEFILDRIAAGEHEAIRHYAGWLLGAARGGGIKLVNPGGTAAWKFGRNARVLDEPVAGFAATPRQIITALAQAAEELDLAHPVHIHCNNLGLPGNWETTLETMRALEGRRAHLTHLQFHSYGGEDWATMSSRAAELAEYVNGHPNLTVDVGQVMFGHAATMTADSPWQYLLHQLTGSKWSNADIEVESGCGIVPYQYRERSLVNALQWAIGLEWFLLVQDPWRLCLTTDHPNGAAFLSYPAIIKLLMSREARRDALARVHRAARERSQLAELDREYSLGEIAIITRAAPARLLGLTHKGHLGVGADADVTLYTAGPDPEAMFANPRCVIKDGHVVVEDGEIRRPVPGRTYCVEPGYDPAILQQVRPYFQQHYTIELENYPVAPEYLPRREVIPCRSAG